MITDLNIKLLTNPPPPSSRRVLTNPPPPPSSRRVTLTPPPYLEESVEAAHCQAPN